MQASCLHDCRDRSTPTRTHACISGCAPTATHVGERLAQIVATSRSITLAPHPSPLLPGKDDVDRHASRAGSSPVFAAMTVARRVCSMRSLHARASTLRVSPMATPPWAAALERARPTLLERPSARRSIGAMRALRQLCKRRLQTIGRLTSGRVGLPRFLALRRHLNDASAFSVRLLQRRSAVEITTPPRPSARAPPSAGREDRSRTRSHGTRRPRHAPRGRRARPAPTR